jgi:hypothetical protein
MFTLGESVVTDALCKPDTLLDVIGMAGGGAQDACGTSFMSLVTNDRMGP